MDNRFFKAISVVALTCALPLAYADVLSFDDIGSGKAFLNSYDGFSFATRNGNRTWFYTDESVGYVQPHSGESYMSVDYRDYLGDGTYEDAPSISNATPFVFYGAWFSDSQAFGSAPADRVSYKLFYEGNLVFTTEASNALELNPQFIASGYLGLIDSVVIVGQQGFYGMDDFTYEMAAPVPEASSYAYLVGGLLMLGISTRRKSASK